MQELSSKQIGRGNPSYRLKPTPLSHIRCKQLRVASLRDRTPSVRAASRPNSKNAGSKLPAFLLVGVIRFKLNKELSSFIADHTVGGKLVLREHPKPLYGRTWKRPIGYRLNESDIDALIAAFKAGTARRVLAKRYSISMWTVKQILREHGVKKRNRYDIQS